ncbi:hypothetical protein IFR05_010684 [Cadophora sp. M221]|nr:hypothetical protein IFR05_010684 [Cadophora sp. M221]
MLSKILKLPPYDPPPEWLLAQICAAPGSDIVEASGDLRIPGFPPTVKQFILANPACHVHYEI